MQKQHWSHTSSKTFAAHVKVLANLVTVSMAISSNEQAEQQHTQMKTQEGKACLDFMGKDAWVLLYNQIDVAECNILDLALSRQQSHKRRRHLLVQRLDCGLILNQIKLLQNDLKATGTA